MPAKAAARRGTGTPRNSLQDLLSRVTDEPEGCWRWTGRISTNGYGQACWRGRHRQAHVIFYAELIGAVPDGMTLDHLCRNRWCVNPAHLEPVTNRENILRGVVPSANRTFCKKGIHDITTPGAIYVDSENVDRCRECRLESKRRHRARRAVAA